MTERAASSWLYHSIGSLTAWGIDMWVRLTGKRVRKSDLLWLESPSGAAGRIGEGIYRELAQERGLKVRTSPDAGLLPDFSVLEGPEFDPAAVRSEVREFYEHTSRYRLEAWSESGIASRIFLWGLVRFVSQRMDQLNVPVSSLELAGGMTSEVLELVDPANGKRVHTGWLRRMAATGRVIYAGLYSTATPPKSNSPCVRVTFPVPRGSAAVFLRPAADPDGSFRLVSGGSGFGDAGYYRIVDADAEHWHVRYISTLREAFHVYVDAQGTLRTDHAIRFLGITVIRLHYKILRAQD